MKLISMEFSSFFSSCWIDIRNDQEAMWTYFAPVMLIMATNIILILMTLVSTCNRQISPKKKAKVVAIRYRLLISMVSLPLLGALVCVALIAVNYEEALFTYLFPGFCVLEGLYIFVFYAVLNRKVSQLSFNFTFLRYDLRRIVFFFQ